jgi:glycosyltransferase involved in cell wall biosynthesis
VMNPILSIIVVTKNNEDELTKTLNSVALQDRHAEVVEIIVVNGGSDLAKWRIPQSLPNFMIIQQSDDGPFDAMKNGLLVSRGRYITFLNSGDFWHEKFDRSQLITELDNANASWLVGGAIKIFGDKIETWKVPRNFSIKFYFAINSFPHQATFYLREQLLKFKSTFDTSIVADWELSLLFYKVEPPLRLDFLIACNTAGGISDRTSQLIRAKLVSAARRRALQEGFPKYILELGLQVALIPIIRSKKLLNANQ